MSADAISLTALILVPTIAAAMAARCTCTHAAGIIRKCFIVFLYVIPWNWGASFDWNQRSTRRETLLIVWFVLFILTSAALFLY